MNITQSNIKKKYTLHSAWEVCPLKNGGIIIHSIYGEIIKISKVDSLIQKVIKPLIKDSYVEISGNLNNKEKSRIFSLINNGVLVPVLLDSNDLPNELRNRFGPVADVFVQFGAYDPMTRLNRFKAIRDAKVGIIGVGGVGSQIAVMLAATGVGYLRIIDGDLTEEKNLTRQIFFTIGDVQTKKPKVFALKERIEALTKFTSVDPCNKMIDSPETARKLLANLDIVILTADQPRLILQRWVNEVCAHAKLPVIFTFVDRIGPFFIPGHSACFACLESKWREEIGCEYDEIVENLDPNRPSSFPSLVSGPSISANAIFIEVIAFLTGMWTVSTLNQMLIFDYPDFTKVNVPKMTQCSVC